MPTSLKNALNTHFLHYPFTIKAQSGGGGGVEDGSYIFSSEGGGGGVIVGAT